MVSITTILALAGIGVFILAGGTKFISPAISKAKIAFLETKGVISEQADKINRKSGSEKAG